MLGFGIGVIQVPTLRKALGSWDQNAAHLRHLECRPLGPNAALLTPSCHWLKNGPLWRLLRAMDNETVNGVSSGRGPGFAIEFETASVHAT